MVHSVKGYTTLCYRDFVICSYRDFVIGSYRDFVIGSFSRVNFVKCEIFLYHCISLRECTVNSEIQSHINEVYLFVFQYAIFTKKACHG